jgi:hypothetical protein
MFNTISRSWIIGGWFATLAVILAFTVATGASLSTTVLLLMIGVAPVVIMALINGGAPAPTVAEILHSVETKDGR